MFSNLKLDNGFKKNSHGNSIFQLNFVRKLILEKKKFMQKPEPMVTKNLFNGNS